MSCKCGCRQRVRVHHDPPPPPKANAEAPPPLLEANPGAGSLADVSRRISGSVKRFGLRGDIPPINSDSRFVADDDNNKLYLYGGYNSLDHIPSPNLYCLDMITLRWTNLTDTLHFIPHHGNLFGAQPRLQRLPALLRPASCFVKVNTRRFMFLFGGVNAGAVSSDLIAINLDKNTWWNVIPNYGPVSPRASAAMVAVGDRVFIFGGVTKAPLHNQGWTVLDSYSILEFNRYESQWRWATKDKPYPKGIRTGYGGDALSVYGGKEILLLKGWTETYEGVSNPVALSRASIFFHTSRFTFHIHPDEVGDFPVSTVRYRSHTAQFLGTRGQTVLIAAGVWHSSGSWIPEIWEYKIHPDDNCRCLYLRDKINALGKFNCQFFAIVGSRCFLVGRDALGGSGGLDVCVAII